MKRTYKPSLLKFKRKHGFRKYNSTKAGRNILMNKISKGRLHVK